MQEDMEITPVERPYASILSTDDLDKYIADLLKLPEMAKAEETTMNLTNQPNLTDMQMDRIVERVQVAMSVSDVYLIGETAPVILRTVFDDLNRKLRELTLAHPLCILALNNVVFQSEPQEGRYVMGVEVTIISMVEGYSKKVRKDIEKIDIRPIG